MDAVRPNRTSLRAGSATVPYSEQRPRHSARAAARLALLRVRLERLRSRLKWLVTGAWTGANFCRLRVRLKRSSASSSRRNGTHYKPPHARACCRITASSASIPAIADPSGDRTTSSGPVPGTLGCTRRRADTPRSRRCQNRTSRSRSARSLRARGRRAAASSIRRRTSLAFSVVSSCSAKHRPNDPGELVGECDRDETWWSALEQASHVVSEFTSPYVFRPRSCRQAPLNPPNAGRQRTHSTGSQLMNLTIPRCNAVVFGSVLYVTTSPLSRASFQVIAPSGPSLTT